jgi:hypothetical protein
MHSSHSRSSSFLLSTLLTRLLLNIVLLIHWGSWTIVLLQKSTFTREMSHFSTTVTWKFGLVGWVIGMNTSSIRLLWIDGVYHRSGIWLLLALLLRWTIRRAINRSEHEPSVLITTARESGRCYLLFLSLSIGTISYWWSLILIFNHQLLHEKQWNEPQSIVVGFDSNEFHELCCSHLFCRIFNISLYKSVSSDELEHIIAKSSSRRLKRTYHLLYLEF